MTGLFTNTTLSASALNDAINSLTLNAQSGAGYTLVLTDAGKLVTLSNASNQNLTIPLNSSVAYATGTVIEVLNIGAGTWTLVPTGGVTLTGSTSIPTSARVRLTKTGTDTWYANTLGGGGLTLVASSSFSASSAVSVNGCFTSAYLHYRVVLNMTPSTNLGVSLRWRVSAADDTNNVYYSALNSLSPAAGAVANLASGNPSTSATIMNANGTSPSSAAFDVWNPNVAVPTLAAGLGNYSNYGQNFFVQHGNSTAFDGLTLTASTGNMTGRIAIYAYQ